ncbi:arsenic resistance N-acetyltransferase ArsN2 [Deinococcus cellulosilyticus]|uniref:Uncharacterized protein n=1 Tax=Deinococcus cellulosilyticus (strain DSM 18568 / NBRC 106333 / KACC 11606 / 5516J-15) TaxID=1223518 RepID=A0A511N1U0_DEIC1|nr:arsenic resistance N-acetyltransferase ArsN2 [Deinococcus cellulosilyticus]GEM46823.1 hypothetical protein DC3_24580 [Deinococcus cellulosilyticus NBRC 106333 = KACC 11606]
MVIRPVTPQDWPEIEHLLREPQLPLQGARDHLSTFVVVTEDESLLAVGGLEVYPPVALLRSVAVAPEHQGKGWGKALFNRLVELARTHNCSDLYLLTTTAAGYFSRQGFQTIPRSELPAALSASQELQGACPDSALAMHLKLTPHFPAADLLRQVTRLHHQLQQQTISCAGSESLTRCHVISELGKAGRLTLMDLVARLKLDKAWLSRNVDGLLRDGKVVKTRHPTDRRASWIELTAAGNQHLQQLNSALDAQTARVLQHIPEEQHQAIFEALSTLHVALHTEFQKG